MKSLIDIYQNDLHPPPDKYTSYFPVYEQFFSKFREKEMTFVEVGVQRGGSLNMWRKYFGASAKIIGIDIDKNVLAHQREDLQIVIGDQADPNFWKQFLTTVDKIDIFLDDGGHTMVQQKNTLTYLLDYVQTQQWLNLQLMRVNFRARDKLLFIMFIKS